MDPSHAENKVLGTAGHIDHGKSSLIKALTGVDPDRLEEEKRRGITIELGFAQLTLPDGATMGVVDVPGHERFVRQMIAGSTGIDVALLCIAADDGIMPQTVEHLAVLSLLSVPTCVVALTKSDLADAEWLSFMRSEIRGHLGTTAYVDAPIIPVSSKTGDGLDELKQTLSEAVRDTRRTKGGNAIRMPIDRVFSIKGSGTVVTGTLWSGTVVPDSELEVLPSGRIVRVRGIHLHNEPVGSAAEGNRVAINLHGLKADDIHPGDFLTSPRTITPTDRFDAAFTYVDTAQKGKPLKRGSRIHVAHGTKEVVGRILFMGNREALKPDEHCYAQIRLEEPLPLSWRDTFVVRSYSPVHVLGGGMVLRCHPKRRTKVTEAEQALLEALHAGSEEAICRASANLSEKPMAATDLAVETGLDQTVVKQVFDTLCTEKTLQKIGGGDRPLYIKPNTLAKYLGTMGNAVLRFHTENPLEAGITKTALHRLALPAIETPAFEAVLTEGERAGAIVIHDGRVAHPKAKTGVKATEDQAAEKLLKLLSDNPEAPPSVPDLIRQSRIDPSLAHRALGSLEKDGSVKRVGTDLCFEAQALRSFKECVVRCLVSHETATAAELRDAMGTSRKYAIPLLEYFDKLGLTKRDGDIRRLGPKRRFE